VGEFDIAVVIDADLGDHERSRSRHITPIMADTDDSGVPLSWASKT
jgi:hypothetical protein